MQEFITGDIMESNTGNKEQVLESAAYLGQIIDSLEDFKELNADYITNWTKKEKLEYSINKINELIDKCDNSEIEQKIVKDLIKKREMLNYFLTFDFSEIENITHKNTHGDYSVMQFIYENGKVKAIIDFATARKLPIAWEIMRSYSYIDTECINGEMDIENLILYVKEFTKYSKLNKYDLKFLPYVYLIQILNSTFGYKQYLNDTPNKMELIEFGFLRTKFAIYLFENAEKISNTLLENIEYK